MTALTKRARVMGRSRKLGHCICDPRKSCPCEALLRDDVCSCAGERPKRSSQVEAPRLTRLVRNVGCASKIPAADLERILSRLPAVTDPRLLIGPATADDAGVFEIAPGLCLVQTVDVFTPSVDDAYTLGRIAACNSLSDIYAMGGRPVTALSIIGYPVHSLGDESMYQMLKGGMDALQEAGVVLVGGHSLNDDEIKFGFAVTGVVSRDAIVTNAGAQPGDALILTKPIGTGIVAFAAQIGRATAEAMRAAADTMTRMNGDAAEAMLGAGAHACTDVTGFGLLGHLLHIVRESGVTAELWWDAVPALPGVVEYARDGVVGGGAERNREYVTGITELAPGLPDYAMDVLCDPQTSGGLLIAVPAAVMESTIAALRARGYPEAAMIGRVLDKSSGRILVTEISRQTKVVSPQTAAAAASEACGATSTPAGGEACCAASAPAGGDACCAEIAQPAVGQPSAQQAFQGFMSAAFAPGALDVVQKELTTISLSVAVQCEPCLRAHLGKALSMGITLEEIHEAAWMGVAFGGCKAMMFWAEHSRSLGTKVSSEGSKQAER